MAKTTKRNEDPVWLRIKSLRPEKRGAQKKLTDWCGVPQNAYTAWDHGDLKSYTKYIDKIAEFYNVSTDWILFGEEKKEKPASDNGSGRKKLVPGRYKEFLRDLSQEDLLSLLAEVTEELKEINNK